MNGRHGDDGAQRDRPLTGVRVLAFVHGMPGALATMLLADYGAEVVLVERGEASLLRRSGGHSIWNRGKRSIVLDLGCEADRSVARQLAQAADIVVEDHRPGVMAGWSLGYTDVAAENDDVVYCSISGYGQTGSRRDRIGWDAAVVANLGIMVEWGGSREGPIFLGHPAIDYSTSFLSVIGILACLRSRLVTGHGDYVDVSLMDGALALYPMNWWTASSGGSIGQKSATGDLRFGYKRLLLRMFECGDGKLIQIHTGAAGAFDRAMEVFGLGAEVSKMQGAVQMSSLLTDRDLEVIESKLPDIMLTKPLHDWLDLLWKNQIAALPVGQPGEALDDPQVRYAGIVTDLEDPALGRIEVLGPSVLMSRTPGAISGAAPTLDQDGDALRAGGWASHGLPRISEGEPLTNPLAGIRIVEFATFFAAPYADRLLSDLGAEVVKIEAIDGDPMRPLPEFFEGANRGKRGIAANLKDPRATQIVRDLVLQADVVQHNLRPGVAERLGIDDTSMRAIRPDILYHYLPGYGSSGPKSTLQSFAPLLSGFVGQFAIGAGEGNRPHATFGNEDYYNGLVGACACLLGLVHRERTGEGQVVESPQLHSSMLTSSENFKRAGRYEAAIPRVGKDLYGWSVGYRIFQTLDAWICTTCVDDSEVAALVRAVVPEERSAFLPPAELAATAAATGPAAILLESHFVERPTEEWVTILTAMDVPAEAVRERSWMATDAFHDAELLSTGRIEVFDHPVHGTIRVVGDVVQPARQSSAHRGRAPLHGEHTREVLAALHYDDDQIRALIADGVVMAAPTSPVDPRYVTR